MRFLLKFDEMTKTVRHRKSETSGSHHSIASSEIVNRSEKSAADKWFSLCRKLQKQSNLEFSLICAQKHYFHYNKIHTEIKNVFLVFSFHNCGEFSGTSPAFLERYYFFQDKVHQRQVKWTLIIISGCERIGVCGFNSLSQAHGILPQLLTPYRIELYFEEKKRQRKYMKNEDSLLSKAFVGLYNIALDLNTFDGTVCVSNKHWRRHRWWVQEFLGRNKR